MATELTGSVEVRRIYEFLNKILSLADKSNYKILIDYESDAESYHITLSQLEGVIEHDNIANKQLAASGQSFGHINDGSQVIAGNKQFSNQAHGGSYTQVFSAATTFDANNGNNQKMIVTSTTTINIANELPGVYIFKLPISSVASPTINIGSSFGTPFDNNAELLNGNGDSNTITLHVDNDGIKEYTINTIEA